MPGGWGVPLKTPAALRVTPLGSVPVALKVGVGAPLAATVKLPLVLTTKVVAFPLVMAGGKCTGTMTVLVMTLVKLVPEIVPCAETEVTPFGKWTVHGRLQFERNGSAGIDRPDRGGQTEKLRVTDAARRGVLRLIQPREAALAGAEETIHDVGARLERVVVGQADGVAHFVHDGGQQIDAIVVAGGVDPGGGRGRVRLSESGVAGVGAPGHTADSTNQPRPPASRSNWI